MFGKNKIMKREIKDTFWVQEIFYTIQGEGPLAGMPAVFVRLGGCNLRCHFCDTDFESSTTYMTAQEIAEACAAYKCDLVVITGGEPFRQNLLDLCNVLIAANNVKIQIETAGTLWQDGMEDLVEAKLVTIVCSPKTGTVHSGFVRYCFDWKYIVRKGECSEADGLPNMSTQDHKELMLYRARKGTVWLQPMMEYHEDKTVDWDKTKENTEYAAALCMTHGHRLTLQLHKMIGLP